MKKLLSKLVALAIVLFFFIGIPMIVSSLIWLLFKAAFL